MEEKPFPGPSSEAAKSNEKDLIAILSYFGILFLIPLLLRKDNPFAQFHAKQGLVLFIVEIIASPISWIPIFGWALWVIFIVLAVIGIVNVLQGKQKPIPIIGQFAEKFKI